MRKLNIFDLNFMESGVCIALMCAEIKFSGHVLE